MHLASHVGCLVTVERRHSETPVGPLASSQSYGGPIKQHRSLAVRRWQRVQAAMRRSEDLPPTYVPLVLGGAIFAVTVVVLVVLVVWPPAGQ